VDLNEPRLITVDIDELVLVGVEHRDRRQVATSFQHELTRLLHETTHPSKSGEKNGRYTAFSLPRFSRAGRLGTDLARSVHTTLLQALGDVTVHQDSQPRPEIETRTAICEGQPEVEGERAP
jgi:hypothetical protein